MGSEGLGFTVSDVGVDELGFGASLNLLAVSRRSVVLRGILNYRH